MNRPDQRALACMLLWGAWSQNRGRLVLTVLAIALGVALAAAVHLINYSARSELLSAVRGLSGTADVAIRGPRSGFSEALYPQLAHRPEVAVVSPVIETEVKLADAPGTLRILGIDPFRALGLQPTLLGDATDRITDLMLPNTALLTTAAAKQLGLNQGDELKVQAGMRTVNLRILGVLPVNDVLRQPLALMDIASAQWAFEQLGTISRLDLRLRPGISVSAFLERVSAALPSGVIAAESPVAAEQSLALSRAYQVNLNMLALVSLFTGAVLVLSTQTLSMLRRRTHFALLRALGLPQALLTRLLLLESVFVGLLGAALGIALGIVLARLGIAYAGGDLGAGFFSGIVARAWIDPLGLATIALCGVGASVLGGAAPALEAGKAPPASALRAGDEQKMLQRLPRSGPGLCVLLLGAVLALLPPIDGLPLFGYAAIACFLIAGILLMPAYARLALRLIPLPNDPSSRLALQQLRGAPGFAGISLAATLASFSLTVAMLVMIHSFRDSLDHWLQTVLPADLYARAGSVASTWIDPETQRRIQATHGIRRVVFSRQDALQLDPRKPLVTLIARDLDPARPEALPLRAPQRLPTDGKIPVWISEAMHDLYALQLGQRFMLPLGGAAVEVTVAGIWRDYVRQGGTVLIARTEYMRLTGDTRANEAWIWLAADVTSIDAMRRLREQLGSGSQLELREPGLIRQLSLAAFDRTFAVTYALQVVAVLIGLFGISVGASAQAVARRREFGMLHHVGMTRKQIGLTLAFEGGMLGTLGVVAGLIVGGVMSLVLIHVINRQSFHWSMEFDVPWQPLLALSLILIACSALTSAISARRALGEDVVRAVKEDW
jgi:putative ABC transport system permease protein